jgi:hypothetical protein
MRNRSSAIAITGNLKKRISTELGMDNTQNMSEEQIKEKFTNYMESKIKKETRFLNEDLRKSNLSLNLPIPTFLDISKNYYTKDEPPILFHDKAQITDSLNKAFIGDIESYSLYVDFVTFLSQFKEDDMYDFDVQELINVDYENIHQLKQKLLDYIQAANKQLPHNKHGNDELLIFFCEKLNDLKKNETNIEQFINNIDKVDGVLYSENKTQVYFNK